jgi:hypothetical protein
VAKTAVQITHIRTVQFSPCIIVLGRMYNALFIFSLKIRSCRTFVKKEEICKKSEMQLNTSWENRQLWHILNSHNHGLLTVSRYSQMKPVKTQYS